MFESRLVNVVHARCTPYLIFYIATQDSTYSVRFVNHCLTKVLSPSMPAMLRCSYASYLASFLSRCGLLHADDVVSTLSTLVRSCEKYARRVDEQKVGCRFPHLRGSKLAEQEETSNLQKHQVGFKDNPKIPVSMENNDIHWKQ